MPNFQETHRREDNVPKRALSMDDVAFLADLQEELNTQDTMSQAHPRFWVIAQSEWRETAPDNAEESWLVDGDGEKELKSLEDVRDWLDGRDVACRMDGDTLEYDDHGAEVRFTTFESLLECFDDNAHWTWPFRELRVVHMRRELKIMPDTLFLAHADCEAHLREYGYRYADDAHAYAMTAHNSPRFKRLIELIQTLDTDALGKTLDAQRHSAWRADPEGGGQA